MDIPSTIISFFTSNLIDRIKRLFVCNFKIDILVSGELPTRGQYSFLFQRLTNRQVSPKDGHPDHNAVVRIHFKMVNRSGRILAPRDIAVHVLIDQDWTKTLSHNWISFRSDNAWVALHQDMPDLLKVSVNMEPDEERTFKVAYSFQATDSLDGIKARLKVKDSHDKWSKEETWIPRHPDY